MSSIYNNDIPALSLMLQPRASNALTLLPTTRSLQRLPIKFPQDELDLHGARVDEARELGYRMMLWPFAGVAPALVALKRAYKELRETGLMKSVQPVTPKDIFNMVGLEEWVKVDSTAGGDEFADGV